MADIYKNVEDYNPNKERKILIVNDDIIIDILSHEKLELLNYLLEEEIRGRKLNILLLLITQMLFYFTKKY